MRERRWRTVRIPRGYELDTSQLYVADFSEQKATGKIRLFFKKVQDDAR